mmetsp:Transcript_33080/g.80400  ORF Transcript_33080/g.80400 Transcript_33080/m.80400 type:complete len:261 (-) Transcript_33080:1480-2262(-)
MSVRAKMEGLGETGRWQQRGMGRHRQRRAVRRQRQRTVSNVQSMTLSFATLLLVVLSQFLVMEMTGVESFSFVSDYCSTRSIYQSGRCFLHPELSIPQSPIHYSPTRSSLHMSSKPPSPSRQPRRMLQKRTNRQKKRHSFNNQVLSSKTAETKKSAMTEEIRPLIKSVSRERGTDYWIDPADYEREVRREQERLERLQQLRKGGKNNDKISDEKLWSEVKAPYKQNWIGYFSVMVAILSMLLTKFPELLEPTTIIQYPDL